MAIHRNVRVGNVCDYAVPGYTRVYVGSTDGPRHAGNPWHVQPLRPDGSSWTAAEYERLQHETVSLYRGWLKGHVEDELSEHPGIGVDKTLAWSGQSARDSAIKALATRVRRGEKLHLLCHCTPGPCHATPLAQHITATLQRGTGGGESSADGVFSQWLTNVHRDD